MRLIEVIESIKARRSVAMATAQSYACLRSALALVLRMRLAGL